MGSASKEDETVVKVLRELKEKYGCISGWRCGDLKDPRDYCGIVFVFPNGKREEANKAQHEITCMLMEDYGYVSPECKVTVVCAEEKDLGVVMACYNNYDRAEMDDYVERFSEDSNDRKIAVVVQENRVEVGRYRCGTEFELDKTFIRDGYKNDKYTKAIGIPILFTLFDSYVNWLSYEKTIPENGFWLEENPGIGLDKILYYVSHDDIELASALIALHTMRKADLSIEGDDHDWVYVPYMYNVSEDALLRMCECFGENAEEFKDYVGESYEKCMRELPTSAEGLPELQSAVISEEEVDY